MSNEFYIVPTKFHDVRNGDVTFGIRIYDGYGQAYCNTWESIPDDDMEVLRKTLEELEDNDQVKGMVAFISQDRKGIYIGDVWYPYDKIKDYL